MFRSKVLAVGAVALLAAILIGCSQSSPSSGTSTTSEGQAGTQATTAKQVASTNSGVEVLTDEEHGHKPGVHGGIMVSLGRDSYHTEAVFETGGRLRLYTLGQDESRVIDVQSQTLRGYVKVVGGSEAESFSLQAEPQDGDKPGRTSQFVGQLPQAVLGQNVEVTIPNIVIDGERFRLGFRSTPEPEHTEMPAKVADGEEQDLYLTPAGKYTDDDIAANGRTVASEKFKGILAKHDLNPLPGDKLCPVTLTKANPKFTWIIGGQPYEFCCPPCVDEFVKLAKEKPDELKSPSEYVQK